MFMSLTQTIHAKTTVSMTDLRRNPSGVLEVAGDNPVAVLNHNKPAAYLLSARAYEALLDKLDDAALTRVVKARRTGKPVKVKLDTL
jgi:antitoxin StbD